MTRAEYQTEKNKISADYKAAKTICAASKDHGKDVCMSQAHSDEKKAKAQQEDRLKPTLKSHDQTEVVKAETNYAMAKVRCNESTGKDKDNCLQAAQATGKTAKNQAKTDLKTAEKKPHPSTKKPNRQKRKNVTP
ncbi:hypothetical protein B9Z51_00805 [Limnohabitans sp. T6-5]|uniref:hypothetical protein n=1 Tax=Limnohabitans sp. T6-5 TaxID=1100724 RepID=UPI000D383432|nr:hypothetical protein [Limnohabitans sp. T6-5]PUE10921.1 hypothetical protein B9Z51_00805 [Limnohabitans sp. T6-5]